MKYKFFAIPARNPELAEAALNAFCSQAWKVLGE